MTILHMRVMRLRTWSLASGFSPDRTGGSTSRKSTYESERPGIELGLFIAGGRATGRSGMHGDSVAGQNSEILRLAQG